MTTATTAATTATTLAIVDELGLLKDQLEMIKEQIADREAQLKLLANGEKVTFTGEMYATTVSKPFDKKSVSWSKVAAELNAPAELVSKYTSVSTNATVTTTAIANVK
jgi:hypothetical protein